MGIVDEFAKALISEGIGRLPEAGVYLYEKGVEFNLFLCLLWRRFLGQ